jgi:hypothetical protein
MQPTQACCNTAGVHVVDTQKFKKKKPFVVKKITRP